MATKERLEQALRNAHNAGDKAAASRLASAIRNGEYDQVAQSSSEVPTGFERQFPAQQQAPQQTPTAFEEVTGAAENVAANTLGVPLSMAGQAAGSLYGIGEAVLQGKYGTMEGAEQAQGRAEEFAQRANIFAPKTEAGQQIAQQVGKQLEPLSTLPPVLPGVVPTFQARMAKPAQMPTGRTVSELADPSVTEKAAEFFSPAKKELRQAEMVKAIKEKATEGDLAGKMIDPKNPLSVVDDKIAMDAMRQGFEDKFIQALKNLNNADRRKALNMTGVIDRGERDFYASKYQRPSDVLGDSAEERVSVLRSINKSAGKEVDAAVKNLKGDIDVSEPVNKFIDTLQSKVGVKFDENFNPIFKGSNALGADKAVIKNIVSRLRDAKGSTAAEAHAMKRMIDRLVDYGKSSDGGVGRDVSSALKELRFGMNSTLADKFPEYKAANKKYEDTITALSDFEDAAGKTIDLYGEGADRALGSRMRTLLSNAQGRVNMENSINRLDETARKYGAKFDDNLFAQAAIVDELEKIYGTPAKTSIGGELGKQSQEIINKGIRGALTDKAFSMLDKTEKQRRRSSLEALKKLLMREQKE